MINFTTIYSRLCEIQEDRSDALRCHIIMSTKTFENLLMNHPLMFPNVEHKTPQLMGFPLTLRISNGEWFIIQQRN